MTIDRRKFLKTTGAAGAAGALATPSFFLRSAQAADVIQVGVLFSLTGGLSIIEKSLADATLMAISEINASGGAKGMKIEPIVEDGASDPKTYNEKASKLVIQDRVPTVFGSYTSASRKAVLPVLGKRNNLYFYPTYYEGFECSKNVEPAPFPTSSFPTSYRGSSRHSARRSSSSSGRTTSTRAKWPRSPRS